MDLSNASAVRDDRRDASHGSEPRVVVRAIPIARTLPDVASHVIEPIAVRWILRDGSDADVAVITLVRVLHRESYLVGVSHPLAVGTDLIAPDKRLSGQPSTCAEFPLRLRR